MSLRLFVPERHPDARLVTHLVCEYAAWWRLSVHVEPNGPANFWRLEATHGGKPLVIPVRSADRRPAKLYTRTVLVGNLPCSLPVPEHTADSSDCTFSFDMFQFLAGMLWHHDVPEEWRDLPVVDLWMRNLFERCLGGSLLEPTPGYWPIIVADHLQKWQARFRLGHLATFPLAMAQGQMGGWSRSSFEMWKRRRPQEDPWYQVPQVLDRLGDRRASFFWLGSPSDSRTYSYDLRRIEYSSLAKDCSHRQHGVGLTLLANPRSASKPGRSFQRVQKLTGQVPDYCRLVGSDDDIRQQLPRMAALGIRTDCSLGSSTQPGFRHGSCIPLRWWDSHRHEALSIAELPIAFSDRSLHESPRSLLQYSHAQATLRAMAGWIQLAGGILAMEFHVHRFCAEHAPGIGPFFSETLNDMDALGLMPTQP